ncbi:MAG: hypothetical protein JWO82_3502 [Akkermansiaceae bacterium]|nr:hypothetical protein [Akkermansiaceae bacterium]
MPALRIEIRDALIAIVAAAAPEYAGHIVPSKLDKVEKGVAASVYLAGGSNEPSAMRGVRTREQLTTVSLFSEAPAGDVEKKLSEQLNDLEKAVEVARLAGDFGSVTSIYLSAFKVDQDPNSKGKRGELHAVFTATFTESLS